MGNPIQHSLSPTIYQKFANQVGLPLQCEKIRADEKNFQQAIQNFILRGGKGLGVTSPLKKVAYQWVKNLDITAQQAQAISMLHIENNDFYGYNFDGIGLVTDIKQRFFSIKNKRCLLLGAGGAVSSVLYSLIQENPREMILANRTIEKATSLATQYDIAALPYETLSGHFDIIINGTTSGLMGYDLPFPPNILKKATLCYDMVYAKTLTPFLRSAENAGVSHLSDGLGMLIEHCARAFYVWTKKRVITQGILNEVKIF